MLLPTITEHNCLLGNPDLFALGELKRGGDRMLQEIDA